MKNIWKLSGALSVVAIGLAGCGGGNDRGPNVPNGNGTTGGTTTGGTNPGGPTDGSATFTQQERLARPLVNEVLSTVAERQHRINNLIEPTQDVTELEPDIRRFMNFPAGRSEAITNVVVAVLVPDLMKADLSQSGPAAYLGVETGGATGSKFGGRKLTDDVVDTSLGIIFGKTVPALGLAPDDGNEIPPLTSDNVGASGHNFLGSFPYLQPPR